MEKSQTNRDILEDIRENVRQMNDRLDSRQMGAERRPRAIFAPLRLLNRIRRWYIPRLAPYLEVILVIEFAILYFFLCTVFGY